MSAAPKFEHKNPLLHSEVIKSFTNSVRETITKMTSVALTPEKPYVDYQFTLQSEIAGVVGVTSNNDRGLFIISFSKDAIITLHNKMLGENETELTDSVSDLVGELSNVIYGSSKTALNEKGYSFKMAIPSVTRGSFKLTNNSKGLTVVMPFKIDGKYDFIVALAID